ncbi:MAG: hypothetical protein JWM02_2017 [Frankiales bacterium]|nr:hypothetical protein [Frankiales bacterium]
MAPKEKPSRGQGGRNQERRARVEALRKQAAARERRQRLLVWGSAGAVAVLLLGVIAFSVVRKNSASTGQVLPLPVVGVVTTEKPVKTVKDTSGIPGVVAYDTTGHPTPGTPTAGSLEFQHVLGPVVYSVTPPVGGPHNATWMNCGIYTLPVPSERAVHNLEHGAVWITYRPDLSAAQVKQLTDFVLRQSKPAGASNRYMDLTPWKSNALPSPIVLSAWGRQLKVTSPTDPRMQRFVDAFRTNPTVTPEYGSPCDGVPVEVGGRPALS